MIYYECDLKMLSAENIVVNKQMSEQLIKDLMEVDQQGALILLLKFVEGLSHEEIAVILNISEATSRKRLSRAMKRMHDSQKIRKYKVRPFIVMLIILAILTACTVKPIREFFIEVFQKFTYFRKENIEVTDTIELEDITFGFVPDGYTCVEKEVGERAK